MANYVQRETKTITTTYTLLDNDDVILADTTAGAFTITVPAISTLGIQKSYIVVHIGSNDGVTLQRSASDLINGEPTLVTYQENQTLQLSSLNTANWSAISNFPLVVSERDFTFENDLDTVREQFLKGVITIRTAVLTAGLSSVSYQTSTDNGATYVTQANLAAMQSWINSNITGNVANGTNWQLKVIATFNAAETKTQNLKLIY